MSFLDRFKKQPHRGAKPGAVHAVHEEKPVATPPASSSARANAKEDTKEAYRVLLYPLVTEKASRVGEKQQYVFAVSSAATRITVARAIMSLYGIRPRKVNILRMEGKRVRFGRRLGKQKDWKKAMVMLKPGQSLPVFA